MARFLNYAPDQGWLLPPRLDDELGADHLACFVHEAVKRLELGAFDAASATPPRSRCRTTT